MKIGFLYSGQGSQVEGMGKELYEKYDYVKDFYDSLDLGFDIKDLSFTGSLEEISQTIYTQGILLAYQISVTDILKHSGIVPAATLGLSLGEYGALYGGGVLDRDTAMEIIEYRSQEMGKIESDIDSSMAAVLTDDLELVENIVKKASEKSQVQVSGINTRRQIVISGERSSVDRAKELLKNKKIRTIDLNTSGAFHTSYMDPVKIKLREYLAGVEFATPEVPVYSNYTGQVETTGWQDLLASQVSSTVQLKRSLEDLISREIDIFVEIGAKGTMAGFVKRLDRNVKVVGLDSLESIENFVNNIKGDKY